MWITSSTLYLNFGSMHSLTFQLFKNFFCLSFPYCPYSNTRLSDHTQSKNILWLYYYHFGPTSSLEQLDNFNLQMYCKDIFISTVLFLNYYTVSQIPEYFSTETLSWKDKSKWAFRCMEFKLKGYQVICNFNTRY